MKNVAPKIKKLAEACLNAKQSGKFGQAMDVLLGASKPNPDTKDLIECQDLDAHDVSFQALAYEFFGPDTDAGLARMPQAQLAKMLVEADGAVQVPGQFLYTSMFSDAVAGLVNYGLKEGYNDPKFIGDSLCKVVPGWGGGFDIRKTLDNTLPADDIKEGISLPAAGLKETRVHRTPTLRTGQYVQVTHDTVKLDLGGTAMESAQDVGRKIRYTRELRQLKCVLGVYPNAGVNPYQHVRDGVASYQYRTAADTTVSPENATVPHNFVNANASLALTDWYAWQTARWTLMQNTDPATGLPVDFDLQSASFLVHPSVAANVATILRATEILTGTEVTSGTQFPLSIRRSENPMQAGPILDSVIAHLLMTQIGLGAGAIAYSAGDTQATASSAASYWWWGNFKKAFTYREWMPFTTFSPPLAAPEYLTGIVGIYAGEERGNAYAEDPRYVFRGHA